MIVTHATPLLLVALASFALSAVVSFQPLRPPSSHRLATWTNNHEQVTKSAVSISTSGGITTTKWSSSSSSSQLRMGVMEDFLSGADASKRESDNQKYLASLQQRVERINALESAYMEDLGDDELEAKTAEFQQRLKAGEDINGKLLEEAFAVVREAAWYALHKKNGNLTYSVTFN